MKKTSSYPLNLASNWKYESHSITFILNISSCCVILQIDINKDVGGTETMTASMRLR